MSDAFYSTALRVNAFEFLPIVFVDLEGAFHQVSVQTHIVGLKLSISTHVSDAVPPAIVLIRYQR